MYFAQLRGQKLKATPVCLVGTLFLVPSQHPVAMSSHGERGQGLSLSLSEACFIRSIIFPHHLPDVLAPNTITWAGGCGARFQHMNFLNIFY